MRNIKPSFLKKLSIVRRKFLPVLFILIYPLIINSQNVGVSNFSEQILDKGAGKVAIGDIDNDGIYDSDNDGDLDGEAGEWNYRNSGVDMSTEWERITFPIEVDAVLALDVEIGTMQQTGHANLQEYSLAQSIPTGKPVEIELNFSALFAEAGKKALGTLLFLMTGTAAYEIK